MQSFLQGARAVARAGKQGVRKAARMMSSQSSSPVSSYNEWDPLEEIIVGRAEGMRVPYLHPNLKVKETNQDISHLQN